MVRSRREDEGQGDDGASHRRLGPGLDDRAAADAEGHTRDREVPDRRSAAIRLWHSIGRADLAHFLVREAEKADFVRRYPRIHR
jgi:hypothetical protein